MNRGLVALIAAFSMTATGCASWLAGQIAQAPGPDNTNYIINAEARDSFSRAYGLERIDFPVGPPEATIAASVIEPRDYGLQYDFQRYENDIVELDFELKDPGEIGDTRKPAVGTVIVLPGMLQSRFTMTFWGIGLAQRGYRVVLLDLRGHGDSSGRHLTYGIVESRDTIQVIEALDAKGLLARPVVALGASYGASTALMAAADSNHIDAVVAFAPFTDAPSSIDHLARTLFPWLFWAISDETMADAIDGASARSGVDLREARAIDVVGRITVPLLLVHGQEDGWVPPQNSFELYRAANGSASLMVVPEAGHMDLPMRYDDFSERVFDWLDGVLEDSAPAVTNGTREVSPEVSS